jgi:hypothetical protein
MSRRFLFGGEAVYGPDSSEYELLGGTRKSERKKPTKKGHGSTGGSAQLLAGVAAVPAACSCRLPTDVCLPPGGVVIEAPHRP